MEEIKQKVQDLELALNYVCYDADLIPKLSKVWEKLELLQEVVNKKCNIPHVSNSVCDCCVPRPEDPFEYDNPICEKCGLPIKQTDC